MFQFSKPSPIAVHTVKNRDEVDKLLNRYGTTFKYSGKLIFPHLSDEDQNSVYVYNIEKYRRKASPDKSVVIRESHWKVWIYKLNRTKFTTILQNERNFLAIT